MGQSPKIDVTCALYDKSVFVLISVIISCHLKIYFLPCMSYA